MGPEAPGIIHEIGTAVTSLKVGDRIAIEADFPCRRCRSCKSGRYNLCPDIKFAAAPSDDHGTLTKYFKLPEDFCYKLPDFIGLDEGVSVEPLAVAVHASRLADIKAGQTVVIFGAGTVGLLCAAIARAMGAQKVVSVDVNDSRLEFAEKLIYAGTCRASVDDVAEDTSKNIKDSNHFGDGADVVLEATGATGCNEAGISVTNRGGTYVQVGLGKSKVEFPIVKLSEKEINMKGCFRYNAGDYDLALHFLGSKKFPSRN